MTTTNSQTTFQESLPQNSQNLTNGTSTIPSPQFRQKLAQARIATAKNLVQQKRANQ